MFAVILGLSSALSWGSADVLARYTSRALGAQGALLSMMLAGLTGLSLWQIAYGTGLPGWPSLWTVASAGLAATAMLMFYEAMKRGPVSMVSPLVGAYPAWMVVFDLFRGIYPGWGLLGAMALTMVGVAIVARFAAHEPDPEENPNRRITLLLALAASLVFSVTLITGQLAVAQDGEAAVLWWGRVIGSAAMLVVVVLGPRPARPTVTAVGWAILQGGLDTLGLFLLYAAGTGLNGTLASVGSSAFGVVTVMLARFLYGERIAPLQAGGIAAVSSGVCALAWLAR